MREERKSGRTVSPPISGSTCRENRNVARVSHLPTPRWIDLKTLDDTRVEMARVYRDMRVGRLDTQTGTRLVYVLGQLGKLIQAHDLEGKIAALEAVLRGRTTLQCASTSTID